QRDCCGRSGPLSVGYVMLLSINNTYLTSLIAYRQHSCLHFEISTSLAHMPHASFPSVSSAHLSPGPHPSGRHDCLKAVCDLRLPHDRRARALAGLPLRKTACNFLAVHARGNARQAHLHGAGPSAEELEILPAAVSTFPHLPDAKLPT